MNETDCILKNFGYTRLIIANYYYSAYGSFPVVDNLLYQYSKLVDSSALNIASDEFAICDNFVSNTDEVWNFGGLVYRVSFNLDNKGVLLSGVTVPTGGSLFIHVFKYV